MNQKCSRQFTYMAALVSASKQHRDTFLIHPLFQSGMRMRKNDGTSSLTMSRAGVQIFTYMAGVNMHGACAIATDYSMRVVFLLQDQPCSSLTVWPEPSPTSTIPKDINMQKHNDVRTTMLNNSGISGLCLAMDGYMRDVPPPPANGNLTETSANPTSSHGRVHM